MITDRMWARLLSSTNQPSFPVVKDSSKISKEEEEGDRRVDGSASGSK